MQKKEIFTLFIILLLVVFISQKLTWGIIERSLLVYEYGLDKVKIEKLSIVKAKPYMIVSNGDEIDSNTQGFFEILYSIILLCFMYLFYKLINWGTKGWLLRSMKELNEYALRKKRQKK